jgi:hypothetical protein
VHLVTSVNRSGRRYRKGLPFDRRRFSRFNSGARVMNADHIKAFRLFELSRAESVGKDFQLEPWEEDHLQGCAECRGVVEIFTGQFKGRNSSPAGTIVPAPIQTAIQNATPSPSLHAYATRRRCGWRARGCNGSA